MDALLEELEQESVLKPRKFTSAVNQPNLIAVNSTNATPTTATNSFSTFTVNLPRPILQADTIQLINANIPQCVPNLPDTALVFWYYRLSEYSGTIPNPNNLYMVRLLPTNYKPEYIESPELYGFNKTFHTYDDVATQLALACNEDLGYYNSQVYDTLFDRNYVVPFLKGEITIPYNEPLNKFQFTGTNATTQFAYKEYNGFTTYDELDVVYVGIFAYQSLQNGNTGNAVTNPTFWKRVYVDIVAEWVATTPYFVNRYVAFNDELYVCRQNSLNNDPSISPAFWELITESGQVNYHYFSTGYNDPNVAVLQSTGNQQWNPFGLFEEDAVVEYEGSVWYAIYQNKGIEPFSITSSVAWDNTTLFRKGRVVLSGGLYYIASQDNTNQLPSAFSSFWTQQAWTPSGVLPNVVGLYSTTSAVDMVENLVGGGVLVPFPVGIAGQPFNQTPKRILNSILGFTFNGVFTPEILSNIPKGNFISVIALENAELYNRLRPIPPYIVAQAPPPLLTLNSTSTSSQTYTADGYANLVYSSIISIYATAVGGSTLDTQENTNLIAQGTMNCGNLGVSFFAPYVETPLLIGGEDIYTLSFTLKDECNDDYILTNNAVVSLVLKVTYKK